MKSSVIRSIKWYLIKNKLIHQENLKIEKKDLEKHIEFMVKKSKVDENEIRRFYKKPSNSKKLEDDLVDRNLFRLLKENAIIKEIKVKTEDLRKQNQV